MTSGGTESILCALKAYRERAKELMPHITEPEASPRLRLVAVSQLAPPCGLLPWVVCSPCFFDALPLGGAVG